MKKVMIFCNAGMSSSLMAKKASDLLKVKGKDIHVDATTTSDSKNIVNKDEYDLYLVSPQTKMYFKPITEYAKLHHKPVDNIPFNAYIPTPAGLEKLTGIILSHID
ncbi:MULTISPECIES: PTS cellobiose transporter subunit IIB [Streptococcus]|uniref:Cellobiose phosphotransferase system IIB component n=3 Tax=Streptococcus parauberis TaxID=1348 RepID=A0A1S1ZR38_9STRE|nr:PTS cellobiose transporter subunit IIB [Streptococcus parauberis]AUT06039.1 Protein-N(pi)-phosphohistidine--sugar phosphotransferase [Streptococcus parauberis]EGE53990.1 cellobiose PTS family porter IIB component [Streptococcus parauberis NCFD 2020]EMF49830.1 PTS system, cellobiose-specific IIB component [Streptococcus parauberis KRS-02109]EMG25915.1 PTS system cellobiose-specific IIB protein [Streptococcus parauberis KRS-02083]MDT2731347.1 PTS cellobiose transporter subunit IIB [Streptococ